MMMKMTNCFCGIADQRNTFSLIICRNHCQRSPPSQISDTVRAGFEPAQNMISSLVEWSCEVTTTTTSRCHSYFAIYFTSLPMKQVRPNCAITNYLFIYLFIYVFIYLCIYLFMYLFIYLTCLCRLKYTSMHVPYQIP